MTEIPPTYGKEPQNDFPSQFHRVLEVTGCKTQAELAEFLGVRQPAVSDAKRRKMIPVDWLLKLLTKKKCNPEWIRTGQGARILKPEGEERPGNAGHGPGQKSGADGPADKSAGDDPARIREYSTDELLAELARRALKHMGRE